MTNGERLEAWRTRHGASSRALGRAIGVSHVTVRSWERGETVPTADRATIVERVTAGMVKANQWRRAK